MRRSGRLQRLALAAGAAFLAIPGGAGADPAVSLHATASLGADSNARRVFGGGEADAVGSALLAAAAAADPGPADLSASYQAAGRKFLTLAGEDTVAQEAAARVGVRPLTTVQVAVDGHVKDRRGGPRAYDDLQAALGVRWRAVPELEVELHGGAHRFVDWTVFEYSYSAPEAGVSVRYRFDRHHALALSGELGHRRYNALAHQEQITPDPPDVAREDGVLGAGATYSYRGGFQLSVGYQYFEADSNSFGETVHAHRVDLTLGTPLPWDLLLFSQLTLQLADYPDGVFLSEEYQLKEDDERSNALSLKLVKPLLERLDLELHYAVYVNVLPQNGLVYVRQVGSVGLAVRM